MLVVSDPGIVAAGHVQRGIDSLAAAGLQTHLFDGARENPTTENIEQGLAIAKEFKPSLIVGLGGGSSMDCAKGDQFCLLGRWHHARLPRCRQSEGADAANDRRADDHGDR